MTDAGDMAKQCKPWPDRATLQVKLEEKEQFQL